MPSLVFHQRWLFTADQTVRSRLVPKKDVLIVDDEAGIRELFRAAVQDHGYLADVAGTVADALKHLEEHRYRLVIVDWRLPDGDGTVVANLAAETGAHTLVMSGYLAHLPAGSVDLRQTIMKPIRPAQLLTIVGECIGKPSVP
jgi:DNA-binding NtrC family response regulator